MFGGEITYTHKPRINKHVVGRFIDERVWGSGSQEGEFSQLVSGPSVNLVQIMTSVNAAS